MFKLKPGNVFQKLNTMDKKQAYTWGAIVVVCFIALITLASFLGDADDASFDGFSTRGYDLAQMPFINDEAEEYLLASKYPDMKNNGSTMLYSQAEKEARQEADAEAAAEAGTDSEESSSSDSSSSSSGGYSSRGYTGGGRSGGTGTPTQVGQLGSASMGHAGGSGVSSTFGAPRGDFSPYKSQEKGSEIQYQLKNTDAKKALSQFARTSRAAAGLKDGKGGNAKKALMGGNIKGSDAFTETGVDLSKASGLELDTNAPSSSTDLSNLDQKVGDGANQAKKDKDDFNQDLQESFMDQLLQQLVSGVIDTLNSAANQWLSGQIDKWQTNSEANSVFNDEMRTQSDKYYGMKGTDADVPDYIKKKEWYIEGSDQTLGEMYSTHQRNQSFQSWSEKHPDATYDDQKTWYSKHKDDVGTKDFYNDEMKSTFNAHREEGSVWYSANEKRQDYKSAHGYGNRNSRSNNNSGSCTGNKNWVCRGSGNSQVCQCE